eukprot:2819499-Pleurochrysis_carterae.AAC.1
MVFYGAATALPKYSFDFLSTALTNHMPYEQQRLCPQGSAVSTLADFGHRLESDEQALTSSSYTPSDLDGAGRAFARAREALVAESLLTLPKVVAALQATGERLL